MKFGNDNYYKPSRESAVVEPLAQGGAGFMQVLSMLLCFAGLMISAMVGLESMDGWGIYLGIGLILSSFAIPIGKLHYYINSVLVNVFAVFFIALSLLNHMVDYFATYGLILFVISAILVFWVKSLPLLTYVSRVLVGGLFIVSGMIKANDPEGFSYKLHDYFAEKALDMEWLNDYAIYLAIIIAVGEIVLGFAVIVGGKIRLTSWTLLLMILFFSWLTFYTSDCIDKGDEYNDVIGIMNSADGALQHKTPTKVQEAIIKYEYAEKLIDDLGSKYQDSLSIGLKGRLELAGSMQEALNSNQDSSYQAGVISANKEEIEAHIKSHIIPSYWRECVKDCGCFGDALKGSVGRSLLPWESFGKDAVLLYFVLIVFFQQGRINLNTDREDKWILIPSLILIGFLCWVFDNWYFSLFFSMLLFGVYLLLKRLSFKAVNIEWLYAIIVTIAASSVALYTYTYLPIKDYRPYAVGSDLRFNISQESGKPPVTKNVYLMLNRETNEEKTFTDVEYAKNWKEIERNYIHLLPKTIVDDPGVQQAISDFEPVISYGDLPDWLKSDQRLTAALFNPEENPVYQILYMPEYESYDSVLVDDYVRDKEEFYPDSVYTNKGTYQKQPDAATEIKLKDYILNSDVVILIVSRLLEEANEGAQSDVNELAVAANEAGIPVFCLTSSGTEERLKFTESFQNVYPFVTVDGTELKIIIRSNPGVVLIHKARVEGKWSSRSIPDFETIKSLLNN